MKWINPCSRFWEIMCSLQIKMPDTLTCTTYTFCYACSEVCALHGICATSFFHMLHVYVYVHTKTTACEVLSCSLLELHYLSLADWIDFWQFIVMHPVWENRLRRTVGGIFKFWKKMGGTKHYKYDDLKNWWGPLIRPQSTHSRLKPSTLHVEI